MSTNWKIALHSTLVALASIVVGALEQYFESGGVVPRNKTEWHAFFGTIGGTCVLGIVALLKQSPLNQPPGPPAAVQKSNGGQKVVMILVIFAGLAVLTGCPANNTTLQKCATASNQAAIIVQGFNTAEIAAHQQGLIPDGDHQFIEQQVVSLGEMGKTADGCIRAAGSNAAALVCINSAIATVSTINQQGGLYLKSDKAKSEFTIVLAGVKAVLQSLVAVLGGPPTANVLAFGAKGDCSTDDTWAIASALNTTKGETPWIQLLSPRY